jgi:hypothetical protein
MTPGLMLVLGASYMVGAIGMGLLRRMDLWTLGFAAAHLTALTLLAAALGAAWQ